MPQVWSTDPGRAGITGKPEDFEAFDIPPLRGIANTAPYFHDNSAETLRDAVDIYSRFILNFFTPLGLPALTFLSACTLPEETLDSANHGRKEQNLIGGALASPCRKSG